LLFPLLTNNCFLITTLLLAQGVVHRDIKPDNVLMHRNSAQLADFGLAVYCNPSQPSSRRHSYLMPEQASAAAKHQQPCTTLHNHVSMKLDAASSMQSSYSTALVDCSIASASTIGSSASTAAALDECACCHSDSEHSEDDTAVLGDENHMRVSANSNATGSGASQVSGHTVSAHQLLCQGSLRRPVSSPELMAHASGTPLYTAPEVLLAMFQSRPVHDVVSHKVGMGGQLLLLIFGAWAKQ
jgi:serine/threonine protein kinase